MLRGLKAALVSDERGASMVEYILLVLIGVLALAPSLDDIITVMQNKGDTVETGIANLTTP